MDTSVGSLQVLPTPKELLQKYLMCSELEDGLTYKKFSMIIKGSSRVKEDDVQHLYQKYRTWRREQRLKVQNNIDSELEFPLGTLNVNNPEDEEEASEPTYQPGLEIEYATELLEEAINLLTTELKATQRDINRANKSLKGL